MRPEADISAYVLDAMRLIAAARDVTAKDGLPMARAVAELLDEIDMLDGAVSPLTVALIKNKFWKNGKAASAAEISDFLKRYAAEARRVAATDTMVPASPAEVLRKIDPEVFGDLPDDLGAPRPVVTRGMTPENAPPMAEAAYAKGADSPEAVAADVAALDDLRAGDARTELMAMVQRGATADEIAAHPQVQATLDEIAARPRTDLLPGYGTDEFWAGREYRAGDQILLGKDAAVDYLWREARSLAWTDEGLHPPETIKAEHKAVILIGAPAAGKSSIANPWARDLGAAIIDADEAKKVIPEFDGGVGVNAVHEESSDLSAEVLRRAIASGTNVVLPKVGAKYRSIEALIATLRENGYRVTLAHVDVAPDEAWRRMIGRYEATGRLISPGVMRDGIDGAPRTYQILKEKGIADDYAKIDNSPAQGKSRRIVEGNAHFEHAVSGRDGRDGLAAPQPASPAASPGQGSQAQGLAPLETAQLADYRADFGSVTFRLTKDGPDMTVSDLLDDIEADDGLANVLNLCNPGGQA